MKDPVLCDDWHPVAAAAAVVPGQLTAASLLGCDLVLWRESSGRVHGWEDRCPHRGARFTLGAMDGDGVVCRHHGWRFDASGYCDHIPVRPGDPSSGVCVNAYAVQESYGLIWACVGTPPRRWVLPFAEYDDKSLRKLLYGPYAAASSGPQIIESFLEVDRSGCVPSNGLVNTPDVPDLHVGRYEAGDAGRGILAHQSFTRCPRSSEGSPGRDRITHTYRIARPLSVVLTERSSVEDEVRFALGLHVQPLTEESSVAWMVLATADTASSDAELSSLHPAARIRDESMVEHQAPLRWPLGSLAAVGVRSGPVSSAYREYLRELGLVYGVGQ